MHFSNTLLSVASLALLARADIGFDIDDTPRQCRDICQPVRDLSDRCDDVDLPGDDNDREEDRLEAQCFCSNDSFDVANVAALCQDCIRQNRNNDDNDDAWEDINEIVRTCGFSSTSYASAAATSFLQSVTVTATRPTATSQLTTTFDGSPAATQTNSNNDDNNNNNNNGGNSNSGNGNSNNDDDNAGTGNAASLLFAGGIAGAVAAGLI